MIQVDALRADRRGASGLEHRHVAIAQRHHDNHRLRFAGGDEAVEDEVRLAHGGPAIRSITVAVQKVKHGIVLPRFGVVAGRCIDVVIALIVA